ncbi:MAG: hypothetical protein QOJ95_2428 [Mycobacterium sp.]|jgi:hypothetical protein|nr:hypothetical protein [Mycobacterium sp.]
MANTADRTHSHRNSFARAVGTAGTFASIAIAATLAGVTAAPSATAATALFVGGVAEPMVFEPIMSMALGGKFNGNDTVSNTPWQRQSVYWPAQVFMPLGDSVSQGTSNLIADIAAAQKAGNGPVTVVGASAGSLVLDETLRYYQEHPDQAPDPKTVNFVVIADGSRQDAFRVDALFNSLMGYTYRSPAQTKYNVSVVTYKYDGFADFPDRPLNLLADLNAVAGMLVLHNSTWFADISNMTPTSVVTDPDTKGTTTKYLLTPQQLPLVTLMPFLAPIQDQLKQMIDAGYSRNDAVATPAPLAPTPSIQSTAVAARSVATAQVDVPATPDTSQAGVEEAPIQTDQTSADVPKAVRQAVAKTSDTLPAQASESTTADTASAVSAPSEPQTPAAKPVSDAPSTTATHTDTPSTKNADTDSDAPAVSTRALKPGHDKGRKTADSAAATNDPTTATKRAAATDADGPKRAAATESTRENRHRTAKSGNDGQAGAGESDSEKSKQEK